MFLLRLLWYKLYMTHMDSDPFDRQPGFETTTPRLPEGYVALYLQNGRGELTDIAVHPRHRRRGIASAMIGETMRVATELGVHSLFVAALEPDTGDAIKQRFLEYGFAEAPDGALLLGQSCSRTQAVCNAKPAQLV